MIKVLHYRNNYLPLSETFIYAYLKHFSRVQPVVACRRIINAEHFPFSPVYKTTSGFRCLDLVAARCGIEFFRHQKITRIVATEQVKIVHAHFGPDAYDLIDVPALRNIPLVTSFYGYDASSLAYDPAWRRRYARLFARGDAFVVEGSCMKSRLEALGCPPGKIHIIRIGVDPKRYTFRERGSHQGPVRLLFCGRFTEKKGLLIALSAINRLGLGKGDLEFRIIGDGELKPRAVEYVLQNRMEEMVRFLGFLPHEKVIEEIESCDIFFQPSVTAASGDTEGGAPTVLLEAQAAGAPIVSTRHADIPEVVCDGKSAFLASEGDVDDIAIALQAMLNSGKNWAEMGRIGRALVEKNHDSAVVTAQLEELYSSLDMNKEPHDDI